MELWKYTMGKDGVKVEHKEDANMFICALCGNCAHPFFDPDDLDFTYCLPMEDEKKARAEIIKEAAKGMDALKEAIDNLDLVIKILTETTLDEMGKNWIEELENYANEKGED